MVHLGRRWRPLLLPRDQAHVFLDALLELPPRPPREERLRPHVQLLHLLARLHERHSQRLGQQHGQGGRAERAESSRKCQLIFASFYGPFYSQRSNEEHRKCVDGHRWQVKRYLRNIVRSDVSWVQVVPVIAQVRTCGAQVRTCGAAMPPILPNMEHIPMPVPLISEGYSSAVNW